TSSFHIGAINLNMSQFDAVRAVELIEEKKVSLLMEFSPMLSSMLEQSEKTGKDMSSLRAVAGIDSPEIIEKYQQVTGGRYYCLYGQTETSCVVTYGAFNERPGSAGRTIPMAEVRRVDGYDRPVPAGQSGEITVKGPMVFRAHGLQRILESSRGYGLCLQGRMAPYRGSGPF
ncbi:MAG: AMP-binding protein, partial [Deltaproteobacteria bacterium]|nr:AMP-binding protein [Deltaproteobacteria bacterium]